MSETKLISEQTLKPNPHKSTKTPALSFSLHETVSRVQAVNEKTLNVSKATMAFETFAPALKFTEILVKPCKQGSGGRE